jgi:hypothetical protein
MSITAFTSSDVYIFSIILIKYFFIILPIIRTIKNRVALSDILRNLELFFGVSSQGYKNAAAEHFFRC